MSNAETEILSTRYRASSLKIYLTSRLWIDTPLTFDHGEGDLKDPYDTRS